MPNQQVEERKKRYAMVVDVAKCSGCDACTIACKVENNVPDGVFRTWVKEIEVGTFPDVKRAKLPRLCNHCEEAPCEKVCPVEATWHTEDGTILIDYDRCIGCKYCITACPYEARYVNSLTKTVDKCTFCYHRVEEGLEPACVATCVSGARIFGDLNDPDSLVHQLVATKNTQVLKPEMGTKPQVYYIDADGTLMNSDYTALKKGEK
ncbi:MAG: sulfate reduction electron transfer complex DsrMKJOP subunit DsrO [Tepidibacillus sp.]